MSETDKPQPKQSPRLSVNDAGRIFWQADPTNPLPGEEVGEVIKGSGLLKPVAQVADLSRADEVQGALNTHITSVLAPLLALEALEGDSAVASIGRKVYESGGIVPRGAIEEYIAGLDSEMRAALRGLKIRLGPILVFMPDLNKPAAVKMKALLWNLWNDKPLPAVVPPEGVVSKALSEEDIAQADKDYYRMIGYPLYGGRAVRIDMLDRVISAVYDSADGGKFKAQHQMAEWLGCPIADLYKVLEDMGHTKTHDPTEGLEEGAEAPKGADGKPELATFRLKKGKASEKEQPVTAKPKKEGSGKRRSQPKTKNKDKNKARVMSTGPEKKLEDSPFAVLAQLKNKS